MFIKSLSITSGASSLDWTFSTELDLNRTWVKNNPISLKVDISESASSGELDLAYLVSESASGNYATPGSGTSVIMTSGTSKGGENDNGAYLIPLVVSNSGVTEFLKNAAFIQIGTRAAKNEVPVTLKIVI